ncbi:MULTISPECIES: ComEA family DNA-binding protein [unclassified Streptomyces]|uniref:ComEA family DNA-binding protein n=1 Tax=unclassified Streptomyces TaxID=2593676 RepID=UPI00224D72D6|nr:ComEA family DNA-binding protein [Streptomyces sp. NBC_00047]MCX5608007.1 ComEA family DNA-binding protein [Streptomyces sp. NBC_00047]
MTLRTRTSHPSGATSGPGRPRLSDGRLRHRRGHGVRRGHRAPHAEPEAVRRRAEALLGGSSPPLPPSEADPGPPAEETAGLSPDVARRLALRERLPVWFQARCGVEPRTVAAVGMVLVIAVGFAAQQFWSASPRPVTAPAVITPAAAPAAAGATAPPLAGGAARVVVDIGGKVRDPGVRRLPAGSRVEDALAAAGGVRPGTDTTGLNRARVLVDGEQVLVGAPAPPPPGGGGPSPGPLSLGSATVEQLDGLPGVGPVLAQHIVEFRTARGGFRSVEELRQVNGIGERRFADLRTLVRP